MLDLFAPIARIAGAAGLALLCASCCYMASATLFRRAPASARLSAALVSCYWLLYALFQLLIVVGLFRLWAVWLAWSALTAWAWSASRRAGVLETLRADARRARE